MSALQDIISELRKITKNCLEESLRYNDDAGGHRQTKQTDVAPRCGGDVDALTLAVPLPHAVVGGHFSLTPWFGANQKKDLSYWYVGTNLRRCSTVEWERVVGWEALIADLRFSNLLRLVPSCTVLCHLAPSCAIWRHCWRTQD